MLNIDELKRLVAKSLKDNESAKNTILTEIENYERWERAVNSISDWVCLVDLSAKIIRSNSGGSVLEKAEPEEMIGMSCCKFLCGNEKKTARCPLERMLKSGKRETTVIKEDYGNRWFEIAVDPYRNENGEILGAVHVVKDITPQKQAEISLHTSEKKFRNLIDQSFDGISLTDEQGKVIHWNRSLERITGLKSEEVIGKSVWEIEFLLNPKNRNKNKVLKNLKTSIRKTLKTGEAPWINKILERKLKRADGAPYYIQATIFPIKTDAGFILCSLSRNITEQKKAEEAVKTHTKQQQTIAELGELALSDKDLREFFDITVKKTAQTLGVEFVEILQILPDKKKLILKAGVGWDDNLYGAAVVEIKKSSDAGYTLLKKNPLIVKDYSDEKRFKPSGHLLDHKIIGGMKVIIGNPEDPFGILGAYTTKARDFTKDDLFFLQGVGNVLAASVKRKHAEQALFESEERFRSVVENSHDGILIVNDTYQFIYVNKQLCQLLGRPPEEILWHDFREFLTSESRQLVADRYIRRHRGENVPAQYEFEVIRKDGEIRLLEIKSTIIKDAAGKIFTVGQLLDITDRRKAEIALKKSEERFRILFEFAPDAYYMHDMNGVFINANKAAEELSGYSKKELNGKSVLKSGILFGQEILKAKEELMKVRNGLESGPIEFVLTKKDGSKVPVEIRAIPVRIDDEELVLGIARDISERKKAELQLSRLASVIEQAGEAVVITDLRGNITYVNPAFEKITGYKSDEILGKNSRLLKSGAHNDQFYRNLWETITSGETWVGTFINKRKDGKLYYEEAVIFPIKDEEGEIINFAAVKRDITNEKKLEEQFHQAQKMEAIGKLAGGVAHDFNNLLTVINGYSKLTLNKLNPENELYQTIEQILKAGEKATRLTSQLLAFSRRQILQPKVLNLNSLIGDLVKMLRRLIGEDIELETILDPQLGNVKTDPGQLEQVILNLAVNARDAMPNGGKLTIETANFKVDDSYLKSHIGVKSGEYIILAVTDNGVGMDEEVKSRIFEPFFTTKGRGKGTGLGLSTVYGIIKQSEGNIWVYSEKGKGTTFKIYLPRVVEKLDQTKEQKVSFEDLHGKETILLVEDDDAVRKIVVHILKKQGYLVFDAEDGISALQLVEQQKIPIDLLITDVIMPRMSGRILADKLQKKIENLKVLYMSGYTDNAVQHHNILEAGLNFIQKPFSPLALARLVREILEKK